MNSLTLIFKCRRCLQGDVVFTYQPNTTTFNLESRCSGCCAVHQLAVELVPEQSAPAALSCSS